MAHSLPPRVQHRGDGARSCQLCVERDSWLCLPARHHLPAAGPPAVLLFTLRWLPCNVSNPSIQSIPFTVRRIGCSMAWLGTVRRASALLRRADEPMLFVHMCSSGALKHGADSRRCWAAECGSRADFDMSSSWFCENVYSSTLDIRSVSRTSRRSQDLRSNHRWTLSSKRLK